MAYSNLGVMARFCKILVAVPLVLLTGCVHAPTHDPSSESLATTRSETIIVYVGGAVNTPGNQSLGRPQTIEHAIQQAGGITKFEGDWNKKVVVKHRGGQQTSVLRKDYGSYILADGDGVAVPRH